MLMLVVGDGLYSITVRTVEAPFTCKFHQASYGRQSREIEAAYVCSIGHSVPLGCQLSFADMLVAARIDTTVFGLHFGSGESARVPGRVCCGVLAF